MNLDIWLRNLSLSHVDGMVNENERYELLKYGVNALSSLPLQTQVNLVRTFADIYAPIQSVTDNNSK